MNKTESQESGEHHLVFASDIKALPSLHFDASVGKKKIKKGVGGSFGGISNSGFLPASLVHLDVSETNSFFFFNLYFQDVDIPYYHSANTQREQKKTKTKTQQDFFCWLFFLDKCQLRCSINDSQPFSQAS